MTFWFIDGSVLLKDESTPRPLRATNDGFRRTAAGSLCGRGRPLNQCCGILRSCDFALRALREPVGECGVFGFSQDVRGQLTGSVTGVESEVEVAGEFEVEESGVAVGDNAVGGEDD